MEKILRDVERTPGTYGFDLVFFCPGCQCGHGVRVKTDGSHPVWSWNGDYDKPTFAPSILIEGPRRCHSFVTNGMIQFLGDCYHTLANQTVPLEMF